MDNTIDPAISSKTRDLEISDIFPYAIFRLQQTIHIAHHRQLGKRNTPTVDRRRVVPWTLAHTVAGLSYVLMYNKIYIETVPFRSIN